MLGEQSGETLSVFDRCEDKMSHASEKTAQKTWRSKHGVNPQTYRIVILRPRIRLSSAERRFWRASGVRHALITIGQESELDGRS